MFMVVQFRRSKYLESVRYWTYKTEFGARRRVWLCNQSADNIRAHYFSVY